MGRWKYLVTLVLGLLHCDEVGDMKVLLSGNEAIARGAYEYGVKVATGYPGTPSSA